MHIKNLEVIRILAQYMPDLDVDHKPHLDLIVTLTWMATLISAVSFQCKPEDRETNKQAFLKFLTCSNKTTGEIITAAKACPLSITFESEERCVDHMDLASIRVLVGHVQHLPKQAVYTWINNAWERGVRQHRIYTCEIEGGIQNIIGIVTGFAADLALFGERHGLLPATPVAEAST